MERRQAKKIISTAFHNPSRGDLLSRRGYHPDSRHCIGHAQSRHCDYGENPVHENGNIFGQGTKFPKHIRPGDITRIRTIVYNAWRFHYHGRAKPQNPVEVVHKYGDGSTRIAVQLNMLGLTRVDAIVTHNGGIHTLFVPYSDVR